MTHNTSNQKTTEDSRNLPKHSPNTFKSPWKKREEVKTREILSNMKKRTVLNKDLNHISLKQKLKYASLNALQFVTHTQTHKQKHTKNTKENPPNAQNLIKADTKKVRFKPFRPPTAAHPETFYPASHPLTTKKKKPI